jgi:hypothetical protein
MRPTPHTRRFVAASIVAGFLVIGLTGAAHTQAAASENHLLVAPEVATGGACNSSNFALTASFGDGAAPTRAASANFQLLGGFNAAPDTPTTGSPWITGVLPRYGPVLGSTTVPYAVHGAELALGTTTNVTIGGQTAKVTARTNAKVMAQLPAQTSPGWKDVTLTNSGGTAYLPRGVGILPMAETSHAVEIGRPFRVTYRGTPGDIIYFAASIGQLPFTAVIPPYKHGVELNIGALLAFIGPLPVTDPSGEFHIDFPGFPFARPICIQFLGLPTANPGYAPGSFTNLLSL